MVVRLLGRAVAMDPLGLPAVLGEEVVDAEGGVGGGRGLRSEEAWVVQEGEGGVGGERGWGEVVLSDVDHVCFGNLLQWSRGGVDGKGGGEILV